MSQIQPQFNMPQNVESSTQKKNQREIFKQKIHKIQSCVKTPFYDEENFNNSSDENFSNNSISTAYSPLQISQCDSTVKFENLEKIQLQSGEQLTKQKNLGDFVNDILNEKEKKYLAQSQITLTQSQKRKSQKQISHIRLNIKNNQQMVQNLKEKKETEIEIEIECQQDKENIPNNQQSLRNQEKINSVIQKKGIKKVTNGFSFKKGSQSQNLKLKHWTPEEEDLFYYYLGIFGLDFNLIEHYIPNKNRKQIMMKYNRENKLNSQKLDLAMEKQLYDKQQEKKLREIFEKQQNCVLSQQQKLLLPTKSISSISKKQVEIVNKSCNLVSAQQLNYSKKQKNILEKEEDQTKQ